jgi:hypothetical protein
MLIPAVGCLERVDFGAGPTPHSTDSSLLSSRGISAWDGCRS